MNRLRELRLKRGLKQTEVATKLRPMEPRIDAAMVSRYESGVCLPTVPQLEQLERIFGQDRLAMYDANDLDLLEVGEVKPRRKKDSRSSRFLRRCFRIPRTLEESLPEDLLQRCGYLSWQGWFDRQMINLLLEYQKKENDT